MSRYFIHPDRVAAFGFDWGQLALTVGPEVNGAARFSGGIVTVAPGGGHARHNHPGAEEIILVVAGTGAQMVEDDDGTPSPKPSRRAAPSMCPKAAINCPSTPAPPP